MLDVWYQNRPIEVHKLESKMKEISQAACLSEIYANHIACVPLPLLCSQMLGVQSHNIISVIGHKNETSIRSYVKETSLNQRAQMCKL